MTRTGRTLASAMALASLAIAATGAHAQREAPTPASPENIKAQCWMKYEGQRKLSIDQRLALVEKCIDEKRRDQPLQREQ